MCDFNPLPRKEGDQTIPALRQPRQKLYFNPLPRKEGDTTKTRKTRNIATNFNPLPRKEGDAALALFPDKTQQFQSTPS